MAIARILCICIGIILLSALIDAIEIGTLLRPTIENREDILDKRLEVLENLMEQVENITQMLIPLEELMNASYPESELTPPAEVTTMHELTDTSGKALSWSERQYVGYVEGTEGISGMCASRLHPGVLYFIMDDEVESPYIYAISEKDASVLGRIILPEEKGDWEDLACGPCDGASDTHCIYVPDTGEIDQEQQYLIHIVQEPVEMKGDINVTSADYRTLEYDKESLTDIQTLMVDKEARIFAMKKTDYYKMYEIHQDGAVSTACYVNLWTQWTGPVGGDISPDGKTWMFKMYDRIYYFHVPDDKDFDVFLEDQSNRAKVETHLTEDYGTSAAWSVTGGSIFTVSEGISEPIYRYYRLK